MSIFSEPIIARWVLPFGSFDSLAAGESLKFMMPIRGADEECFLINFAGEFHAYVNRCRHVPMAMDWVDNQFFAERGRYLMCQTHNAYYEPSNGECIAGPPDTCGKMLYRVPLEIDDGNIYAVDSETGRQIWKRTTGGPVPCGRPCSPTTTTTRSS